MNFSPNLSTCLDVLTEALDGSGDDLHTILSVLVDDLSGGIPSFCGLSITMPAAGDPLTVTAMNSYTAATSMLMPLRAGTQGGHILLYAQNAGAFTDLAADARTVLGPVGDIVVDGHLPPPTECAAQRTLAVLGDRSSIDQALGVLIGEGYPPTQAHSELRRRATAAGASVARIAQQIMQTDHPSAPDPQEVGDDLDERAG